MGDDTPTALGALRVDEEKLRGHVDEVVRSSVFSMSRPCKPASPPAGTNLVALVRLYLRHNRPGALSELNFFRTMPSLKLAGHHAAYAINHRNKRFGHQCRITRAALAKSAALIGAASAKLRACASFEELHEFLKNKVGAVGGIGELYLYDTTLRLGAYLGLSPKHVYMHTGTRIGARALGLDVSRHAIPFEEFPPALQSLSASELEDFLCIYKARLGNARTRPTDRSKGSRRIC